MADFTLPTFIKQEVATPLSETSDWWFDSLGLSNVHKIAQGKGVRVGIADTGCDVQHEDLAGAIIDARDFTRSRIGIADAVGHGTWCACALGARRNNAGGIGTAPLCELVIAKVLGDNGSGSSVGIAAGIDYLRESGCRIISMSLGSPGPDQALLGALTRAVQSGIFVFCAAGNSGRNSPPNYPAAWDQLCVAVGACDRDGRVSTFSSWGAYVDVVCYGQDVLAGVPGNKYARFSGSSMSTPIVAGVGACLLERHDQLGAAAKTPLRTLPEMIEHLKEGARDAGDPGRDNGTGWGLIDPQSIIKGDDAPIITPPPAEDPYEIHLPGGLILHWPAKLGDLVSLGMPAV